MSWLDDSKVGDKWTALKASCDGAAGKVPATEFAEAALTIISVFDLISGMGMASGDMKGNADTVKSHAQKAAAGATLQDLIEAEIAGKDAKAIGKIVGDGKTISCALLWLIRALKFIEVMIANLDENRTMKMKDCVYKGYEGSLKPYHGMIIRGTFSVAVNAAPTREAFISKLAASEDEAFTKIKALMPVFSAILKDLDTFLKAKGIEK